MKKTGFFRLCIRSLPEIWFCQVVIGAILWFPMTALNTVVTTIASSGDFAVTTANIRSFLSPRVLEMLVCSFLLVFLLVVGEICAPICLCEAIQKQEKTGVLSIIKKSIKALPRFITEVIEKTRPTPCFTAWCFPYLTTPHRNVWQSERCGVYKRRHLETHIKHSFKTLYFDQ